ncbi:MAG: flavin reductase family protein [Dehalococcoidia bacterium]|nr:flavin reductase family protein [Dehalococcoidia bacterium]
MAKVVQLQVDKFYFHYPAGATIVTSHAHGRDNAMSVAWHTAMSHEPPYYLVSISPKRFTHQLIVESGEFTVNFMPSEKAQLVALVAGCSGRDIDKFRRFQIEAGQGTRVKSPVLAAAFAAYECRVVGRHTYGDHDLFVGEVLAVQWEETAFLNDGTLDMEGNCPVVYMGGDWYASATQKSYLDRRALVDAALGATSKAL